MPRTLPTRRMPRHHLLLHRAPPPRHRAGAPPPRTSDLVLALLGVLLLAAFAGVSILEASLAERRPAWFALASIVSWVVALIAGAFMIWMPEAPGDYGVGAERFFKFILIVLILQAALLHIRLYSKSFARHQTTFTSIVAYVTMGLVVILAVILDRITQSLGQKSRKPNALWRALFKRNEREDMVTATA